MHRIVVKFVSKLLTNSQKEHRINVQTELENLVSEDKKCFFINDYMKVGSIGMIWKLKCSFFNVK